MADWTPQMRRARRAGGPSYYRAEKDRPKPGSLNETLERIWGIDTSLDRASILPMGNDKGGSFDWRIPEVLVGAMRAASLPGHVMGGGSYTEGDVTEMALETAGVGSLLGKATPKGSFGIFGGRGAAMKDGDALERALKMDSAGRSPQQTWDQTGWYMAKDKADGASRSPRFEIDDSGMTLTKNPDRPGEFLVNHPELEKNYPGITDDINSKSSIRLGDEGIDGPESAATGSFNPITGKLKAREADQDTLRSTVLHELQHKVQTVEGHSGGGSPQNPGSRSITREMEDRYRWFVDNLGQRKADNYLRNMVTHMQDGKMSARQKGDAEKEMADIQFSAYRRLQGEQESFQTEARRDMNAQQRRRYRPIEDDYAGRIPLNQQVARGDIEAMESNPGIGHNSGASGPLKDALMRPRKKGEPKLKASDAMSMVPAAAYAQAGPPKDKPNQKGVLVPMKADSQQEKALRKQVAGIDKTIKSGDYKPYFDVSKRTNVDPKKYPKRGQTLTSAVAKQQKTNDAHDANIGTAETRKRLQDTYNIGDGIKDAGDWYFVGQLEKEFIKHYGAKEGRKQFQEKFARSMANTTAGNNPTTNLRQAMYNNYMAEQGLPMPSKSHQVPALVGGRYGLSPLETAEKGRGQAISPEQNPKRHDFEGAFLGERGAAVVDEQMTGVMTPGKTSPPSGQYGAYQKVLTQEAEKAGVDPIEFQEKVWAGSKKGSTQEGGVPMIQTVNEAIERTSKLLDLTPAEVILEGFIKSKIPVYGLAGVGVPAALLGDGAQAGEPGGDLASSLQGARGKAEAKYPYLKNFQDVRIQPAAAGTNKGDRGEYLGTGDSPDGKPTITVGPEGSAQNTIVADMVHHAADTDPEFREMKQQLKASLSPAEIDLARRRYEQDFEGKQSGTNFETFDSFLENFWLDGVVQDLLLPEGSEIGEFKKHNPDAAGPLSEIMALFKGSSGLEAIVDTELNQAEAKRGSLSDALLRSVTGRSSARGHAAGATARKISRDAARKKQRRGMAGRA